MSPEESMMLLAAKKMYTLGSFRKGSLDINP
jgi:hypothetical protein